jgi:hypothetical protein
MMKREVRNLRLVVGRPDGRHVQLGLAILSLVLFVLGASAPSIPGGH